MMAQARPATSAPVRRLSGYKEIAAHIERIVGWSVSARTVRRWTKRPKAGVARLPVQFASPTQAVAVPEEIESWCVTRWPDIIGRTGTR